MMNQFCCVGRLVSDPEKQTSENGKSYLNFTLAVPRSYKNADGEYETDFIDCTLFIILIFFKFLFFFVFFFGV